MQGEGRTLAEKYKDKDGKTPEYVYAIDKLRNHLQSLKIMGPTLSSIADGVKDWSDLKIPVYEGSNDFIINNTLIPTNILMPIQNKQTPILILLKI